MQQKPTDLSEEQVRAIVRGTYFPESRDHHATRLPRPNDLTAEELGALSEGNAAAELFEQIAASEP